MASLFSSLNPVPSLAPYTGPHSVGTVDIEILAHSLAASPAPDPAITTVAFRLFYPCEGSKKHETPPYWIPNPQSAYVAAFARFLGAGSAFASVFAQFSRLIYHTKIPALRNAQLSKAPTSNQRWPCLIFSHGLGGSRNGYSQIAGLLASHGLVVIAAEHRDGSAPISFFHKSTEGAIEYKSISHQVSQEVLDARDAQLRVRMWELNLIYEAMVKIDKGNIPAQIASDGGSLNMFASSLNIHEPGRVAFAGHSFGAATALQFVKSVFYRQFAPKGSPSRTLFNPSETAPIAKQITSSTTLALLDLWSLPLASTSVDWLQRKPLPCYTQGGPGGSIVIAILSEAFFKWKGNLVALKRALSVDPTSEQASTLPGQSPPHIFYPQTSAHLSQSDFGILFPWLIKRFLKAQEPERTLLLNARAILETLRQNGMELSNTTAQEMEESEQRKVGQDESKANGVHANGHVVDETTVPKSTRKGQDWKILQPDGGIRAWIPIALEGEKQVGEGSVAEMDAGTAPSEVVQEVEYKGR
ncbi:hypothetical protein MMC25_003264 [Agyrium rufum]|nr:hypothetical protein [Agyrium rufum]